MALGFRGDDSLGGIWAFLTFQKQDRELSGLGLGAALGFGGVVCCRFGFGVLVCGLWVGVYRISIMRPVGNPVRKAYI